MATLFCSLRTGHGNGVESHDFFIWAADKTANGWKQPHMCSIGQIEQAMASRFSHPWPTMEISTLLLIGTQDRFDIYRSRLVNGESQAAGEDLGPNINGDGIFSLEALIAPDESYLLIGSFGRQPSLGNSDLFISYNRNGAWSKPVNLGPEINTAAREYSPRITPDGKWLIFTSERGMQTDKRDQPFSSVEFSSKARGILDGLGNLYRIPMEYVLRTTSQ